MNVLLSDNKLDCVFDYITDNRFDMVGITYACLSNNDTRKYVVNMCLDSGYTLHHRSRNTGRRGGGVGVLINISNNNIYLTSNIQCIQTYEYRGTIDKIAV